MAVWLSQVGGPVGVSGLAGIAALGLWMAHRRRAPYFFSLAVGGAVLLNQAAKYLLTRPRSALWAVLHPELSYSFPSGRIMAADALAAALDFLSAMAYWVVGAGGGSGSRLGVGYGLGTHVFGRALSLRRAGRLAGLVGMGKRTISGIRALSVGIRSRNIARDFAVEALVPASERT